MVTLKTISKNFDQYVVVITIGRSDNTYSFNELHGICSFIKMFEFTKNDVLNAISKES